LNIQSKTRRVTKMSKSKVGNITIVVTSDRVRINARPVDAGSKHSVDKRLADYLIGCGVAKESK